MFAGASYLRACEHLVHDEPRYHAAQGSIVQPVGETNVLGAIRVSLKLKPPLRIRCLNISCCECSLSRRFSFAEQPILYRVPCLYGAYAGNCIFKQCETTSIISNRLFNCIILQNLLKV